MVYHVAHTDYASLSNPRHPDTLNPSDPMPCSLIDSPGTLRPMLRLTMPVLAEQMLHLLVGFTDMWLTGNCCRRGLRRRDDADDLRAVADRQLVRRSSPSAPPR